MRPHFSLAITMSLAGAVILPAQAQGRSAGAAPRSTLSGVYSTEQAARGRDVYAAMCKTCHTAASHSGVAFHNTWDGRPLSELFGYISTRMPKNEPGSLAQEDYADVLAYLLKLNQMPAGDRELPADSLALTRIRIDTVKARP